MKLPHRRQFLHLVAGAAALPVVSRVACAQTYPTLSARKRCDASVSVAARPILE